MPTSHLAHRQRGVALLVALVFLIVLTLLGLATMRTTTLQEKAAGGGRDYNIALQAAEAALRDAEVDIRSMGGRSVKYFDFPVNNWVSGVNPATRSGCQNPPLGSPPSGLCVIDNPTIQLYLQSSGYLDWGSTSTSTVPYGYYTGATPLVGVTQQPRYFFELMRWLPCCPLDNPQNGGTQGIYTYVYVRITARGWGASGQTQVYLQEVYLVPITG